MAKRSFAVRTLVGTAFADAANLTNDVHYGVMQGGTAIQRNHISEIMLGGQAGASTPTFIVAGMNSLAATVIVVGIGELAPLEARIAHGVTLQSREPARRVATAPTPQALGNHGGIRAG